MKIAIIATGNMGHTLGLLWAEQGDRLRIRRLPARVGFFKRFQRHSAGDVSRSLMIARVTLSLSLKPMYGAQR